MQNPYANKNKLPHDPPMFFGRDAEIRNIRASLGKAYPESVSIIGERRIGKSPLRIGYFMCRIQTRLNLIRIFGF